jgi:hypothetical protein
VYESVQKFGGLITSGKITNGTDVSKIAELLLESSTFYDAEMISSLINTMLHYTRNWIMAQVVYVESTKGLRSFIAITYTSIDMR